MKALIYCRVSSDRQVEEGHGLEGQEKRCRDYAKNLNYEIVGVFREEGISGGIIDRPQMQRLLVKLDEYKEMPDKTIVIIDDIKRLARSVEGHFLLKTAISSRNGTLESPSHRFEDSPEGKFVETVLAGAAELERNQNKQQVINRMKARAESGHWPFCLPPGLVNKKDPIHGKLATPEEPIASIFKAAIEGYRDRTLLTQLDVVDFIAEQYKIRGLNRKISLHGVQRLLTEILYCGYIEYPHWNISRRKAVHDGFISVETFDEVQRVLHDRFKPKTRRDTNPEFPLRGLTLCSLCRKPMTASFNTSHNGQRYPNYFCKTPKCSLQNKIIHRDKIETDFLTLLTGVSLDQPMKNLAIAVLTDVRDQYHSQYADAQNSHQRQLQELTDSISKLTERIGKIENDTLIRAYEAELMKLGKKKEELDKIDHPAQYTSEQFGTATKKVMDVLEKPVEMWQTKNLDDQLTVFFMHFDQKLVYDRESGFGTAHLAQPVEIIRSLGSNKISSVEMPGVEPGSERAHFQLLQA